MRFEESYSKARVDRLPTPSLPPYLSPLYHPTRHLQVRAYYLVTVSLSAGLDVTFPIQKGHAVETGVLGLPTDEHDHLQRSIRLDVLEVGPNASHSTTLVDPISADILASTSFTSAANNTNT